MNVMDDLRSNRYVHSILISVYIIIGGRAYKQHMITLYLIFVIKHIIIVASLKFLQIDQIHSFSCIIEEFLMHKD